MMLDDKSELPIYRVISLWLENKENEEINEIVNEGFKKNPSYKFITILPQLVAHLNVEHKHTFHKSLDYLISIQRILIIIHLCRFKILIYCVK